ncbi:cell division protein FtsA [Candidatus Falkowbacteria bacterium]|nr:cell division protein FtsA [Candidatus Falkowbacteria bacterium]
MARKEKTITGIDVGSINVKVVMAQEGEGDKFQVIGGALSPSAGVSKGVISSIEDAVSSISGCLEKVERMTGMAAGHAYVGISGSDIISQETQGVVAVAKADNEIREDDVERALGAAQTVATPPNYEVIHVIPRFFKVDSQEMIKDPVGMTGVRLEVEAQMIEGPAAQIKNLTKCVYRTGVDIDDLVFGVLATAEAVLGPRQKELGVAVVNIGGATTSVAVFEEGDVLTAKVLPVGANHITNDIAIGLRTSIELAEQVKLDHGMLLSKDAKAKDEINLAEIDGEEEGSISKKELYMVIEARVEEIFSMVDEVLKDINRSGKLPSGVVLTGGGAMMPGMVDMAKKVFRLPASLGYPKNISTVIDKVNDLDFSTAVGLVLWGRQLQHVEGGGRLSGGSLFKRVKDMVKRLKP